jgi:hypothetical protein
MASDVDAVIAALRIVLHEAETRASEFWWKTHLVNRWINRLPGAWRGRWRHLRLRGDIGDRAKRTNVISHLRATLAYLEINRETIAAKRRSWWPFGMVKGVARKKMVSAAEKPETAEPVETSVRPKWLN